MRIDHSQTHAATNVFVRNRSESDARSTADLAFFFRQRKQTKTNKIKRNKIDVSYSKENKKTFDDFSSLDV
jgi:hypothetical protein